MQARRLGEGLLGHSELEANPPDGSSEVRAHLFCEHIAHGSTLRALQTIGLQTMRGMMDSSEIFSFSWNAQWLAPTRSCAASPAAPASLRKGAGTCASRC